MGVAQNCEIIGRAKGQGGETACTPYYLMADMCSETLHHQSYLEMLWSKTVYSGLLGNNHI